jgi:hypothetical protein
MRRQVRFTAGDRPECAAMSFPEIGKVLGVSHNAAWSAYQRGMEKLARRPQLRLALEMLIELDRDRRFPRVREVKGQQ